MLGALLRKGRTPVLIQSCCGSASCCAQTPCASRLRRLREVAESLQMSDRTVLRQQLVRCILSAMQQGQCNESSQHLQKHADQLATTLIQALAVAPSDQVRAWIRHRLRTSQKPDRRSIETIDVDELKIQLDDVKRVRNVSRKAVYTHSKLDPYRKEIEGLIAQGASQSETRDWLRRYRRIRVDKSTISRSLKRWKYING